MLTTPYDMSTAALLHPDPISTRFVSGGGYTDDQVGAECARLAYVRFETDSSLWNNLTSFLAQGGFITVTPFEAPAVSTFGFGAFSPVRRTSVVAFRGTQPENWENWRTNLSAFLVPWSKGGHVHDGFSAAALAVSDQVSAWLEAYGAPISESIIFAGHSLGGAVATVLATLYMPHSLVTIGTPRVGDTDFCDALSGINLRRYQNCADLVTNVPPRPAYKHATRPIYIDHTGNVREKAPPKSIRIDKREARQTYQPPLDGVPLRDLADHAPINYLRAIIP